MEQSESEQMPASSVCFNEGKKYYISGDFLKANECFAKGIELKKEERINNARLGQNDVPGNS